MLRLRSWPVVALLVAVPALTAAPAPAAAPLAPAAAGDVAQRAVITFDKSLEDPSDSRLTWQVLRQGSDGAWSVVDEASWRAGAGMLGKAGRNECAKGRGWLPDGTYRLRYSPDYPGTLIKGRAFRLDDHRCRNGRKRVALFIHTEQGAHSTQCRNRPGDQVCRWEMPRINDYKSAGCIKMAPGDLAELSRHFLQFYRAGVRYPKSRVVVRVVP
jgi:hypothetical protein